MEILFVILIIVLIIIIFIQLFKKLGKSDWKKLIKPFPASWRKTLFEKVNFYNKLNPDEKQQFEFKIHEFLINCRITGVDTEIFEPDRILVAASAIIPIFAFSNWQYFNLREVLLYPDLFNEQFNTDGEKRNIAGMVGTGYMEGKMILSKQALHHGFKNETDKKYCNT